MSRYEPHSGRMEMSLTDYDRDLEKKVTGHFNGQLRV